MNRYKKQKRFVAFIETFKSIVLGLLVVSMLSLVVVYFGGTYLYEEISASGSTASQAFDKLWSVEGGATAEGLDGSRLLPEWIGYRQGGSNMMCVVADLNAASELYKLIKPCLLELFGSDALCRELPAEEGEACMNAAVSADEFIYLRYHIPIPYQLIYAYASDKLTISESDIATGENGSVTAYVSELVIIPDYKATGHRFLAYASDANGGYFEFYLGEHIVSSGFYISRLAETGSNMSIQRFHFSTDTRLFATQPIVEAEIEYDVLSEETIDFSSEEILTPLLRLFGYNPDKLNSYVDDTGASVYVDSSSRLRIHADHLSFITNDALSGEQRGIQIDSLLGYSSGNSFTLFDKLTAVDTLIRRLGEISPSLIGGEASLCLGNIYSSGSQLVIEYILTYNNILISDEAVLRAVLTQDTISRVELLPRAIHANGETHSCLTPKYTLRKLTELNMLPSTDTRYRMRMQYNGSDASWAVTFS